MPERREERFSLWSSLARYFVHGLGFSGLLSFAVLVWLLFGFSLVVVMPFLTIIGIAIALVVSAALLLVALGGLNSTLTERIWHVPIDQGWGHVAVHSIVLLFMLIVVGIPSAVVNFLVPSWVTSVVLFFVYGFVDGFVAKKVAFIWKSNEMRDEGFRGFLTMMKYPVLLGLFAGDAVIAAPIFITSLASKFWWEGTIFFFCLQSPLIYLVVKELMDERNKVGLPRDGWWTPGKPGEVDSRIFEHAVVTERVSRLSVVRRVFLHGLAYSLLAVVFAFVLIGLGAFTITVALGLPAFLVTVGLIVGFVLAFIIDLFVLGTINTMLTKSIWHAEIKHDWKHLLIHGLALNATFAIASIPVLVIDLYSITVPIALVQFIVYCFVYGTIGRRIAFTWENKGKQSDTPEMREHQRYQNLINV